MSFQERLIEYAMRGGALKFAVKTSDFFPLKSGRLSPYFFNAATLYNGEGLTILGLGYAEKIMGILSEYAYVHSDIALFGPSYKGYPLATVASVGLWTNDELRIPVVTARKEVKDHGEGGTLIGASIKGKHVIVTDDVLTAGTAVRESLKVINEEGGILAGVVVIFDREERGGTSECSAVQEIQKNYSVPVLSILSFREIREYLQKQFEAEKEPQTRVGMWSRLEQLTDYHNQYGVHT